MKNLNSTIIKNGIMIMMGVLIIFLIVFKKSPIIDSHKNEINKLQTQNKRLQNINDSLFKENLKLDSLILVNKQDISNQEILISEANRLIDRLNKRRNNITVETTTMSANEVSQEFNKYLKSKK